MIQQGIIQQVIRAILAPLTAAQVVPVFAYAPSRRRLYIPRV
jgi:hypothetical protein